MKGITTAVVVGSLLLLPCGYAGATEAVDRLLEQYQAEGAGGFSAADGAALWRQSFDGRSCTSCHTADPKQAGRHRVTGKAIQPMAPSVNPDRLSDVGQVRKWLLRNCKWTLGRECTAQEKGNLLIWLQAQ